MLASLSFWPLFLTLVVVAVAAVGVGHVILNKRDVRAAIGWAGLIVLSPLLGAAAYSLFGINRIRRRAARLTDGSRREANRDALLAPLDDASIVDEHALDVDFAGLPSTVARITGRDATEGNRIEPLIDGDAAYPAMLDAIAQAERSILLVSYIFDNDAVGQRFVEALSEAQNRGVVVRVLIDSVGARYSMPPIRGALRNRGIPVEYFLPARLPLIVRPYMNLRNHRKILVIDGRLAFVGGMNIRDDCMLEDDPDDPTQDLHFVVEGPAVAPIFEIAADDWCFTTEERLDDPAWAIADAGRVPGGAGIQAFGDGPDEDFETLRWTLLAVLAAAQDHVRIQTPYFLPDQPLIAGLRLAVLRGVRVEILLPERNNLRFVQWASTGQLWQVIEPGCRVWLTPAPFDHSKSMVVDGAISLVGSANWDMRSLRLNFELGLACYDPTLAHALLEHTTAKMRDGRELTLESLEARPLPIRLRDGAVRLLAPYL